MSASNPTSATSATSPLALIYTPFIHSMSNTPRLPNNCLGFLLQRGINAIHHAFSIALLCTANTQSALASAQATSERFHQFVSQTVAEKVDISLLCEAFSFSLRGTTFSRVLDDNLPLSDDQNAILATAQREYIQFTDHITQLYECEEPDLQPLGSYFEAASPM